MKILKQSASIMAIRISKLIPLFILILFTSCASNFKIKTSQKLSNVALMSSTLTYVHQGGISSTGIICRNQFNELSDDFNHLMQNTIDPLHNAVAQNITKQIGSQVIYGVELHSLPTFQYVKDTYGKPNALIRDYEYYPEIFISNEDPNLLIISTTDMTGGGGAGKKMDEASSEFKNMISDVCARLNVDYLAFSEFTFMAIKGMNVTPPEPRIIYKLSLYDRNGNKVGKAQYVKVKGPTAKAKMMKTFSLLIDEFIINAKAGQLD